MIFGPCCISPQKLAELIEREMIPMSRILRARDKKRSGQQAILTGQRSRRTKAIKVILRRKAAKLGLYCFPNSDKRFKKKLNQWLVDLIWWNDRAGQRGVELAVESEWNIHAGDVVDDFEKLLAVKSPLKLMIYRVSNKTRQSVWDALQRAMREYRHHVKDENYIFCEFQPGWSCTCRLVHIPKNGVISVVKSRELIKS